MKFLKWWVFTAPKRLTTIFGRVLILVNNEASFFLNLRMLFVPLFGDYTWIGRLMVVVYRAFKIVIGLAFLAVLFIFGVVVVVSWYLLPIFAARYLGVW